MTTLTIEILNPKEEALFLAILDTFKKQKIIRLKKTKPLNPLKDSHSFPDSPMTENELDEIISKAEKSPSLSYEEVKKHFTV